MCIFCTGTIKSLLGLWIHIDLILVRFKNTVLQKVWTGLNVTSSQK